MAGDVEMPDVDAMAEEKMQYGYGALTEEELDEKYPNRPHNIHKTLPFHELFTSLFNPLDEHRKKPSIAPPNRRKQGPHGRATMTPHEARRNTIERFISRWRSQVGNDIYPAFRLIIPEKDRDRAMYGLKEKLIAKMLIKVTAINKDSEDAYNMLNWKLPGLKASASAGDFAGRCFEVLNKRAIRFEVGTMTVAEVNERLDKLAAASKESDQLPFFEEFYRRMNPEEMMWLIRMILRQMKVGATEKTFFDIWHPDAESLFNVSSSLRRVCWELYDPSIRLDGEQSAIALMQCFQPQLASFQMYSFEKMVEKMSRSATEDDKDFWVEEKLDGERMQLHMIEDDTVPGGKRFSFWSRKAKEYTYLYGSGFEDDDSALTRHLKDAFKSNVRNIILDGEMITWNTEQDAIVGFGTLKTAALSEQRNPFGGKNRPVFRVFDCLFLNDRPITQYTLRDRRKALDQAVVPVHRRLEIHEYKVAQEASEIEPLLRQVVAEASEGLVLKNPRSSYRLSERNDDWHKVKPEYMTEFGEALDCVIIGGYWGSGRRGGTLSSFLCGLRVNENQIQQGANPQKCYSFFKVGGGMTATDYAEIRELTKDKWRKYDPNKPPLEFIELAGGQKQYERPDEWIKPEDSVVVEVKAASVGQTDQFRMNITLRFPRFKRLRKDKTWREALSIEEFIELKNNVEEAQKSKAFEVDDHRKKRKTTGSRKRMKPLTIAGAEGDLDVPYIGPDTKIFEGLNFFIIGEAAKPIKKSKVELEQLIKANGGNIVQSQNAHESVICIAEKELVKVRSIKKDGKLLIVRPLWIIECLEQSARDVGKERFLLPMEPRHMFHTIDEDRELIEQNTDQFGDSYCRDVNASDLRKIFEAMPVKFEINLDATELLGQFEEHGLDFNPLPGWLFRGLVVYFDQGDVVMENGSGNVHEHDEFEFVRQQVKFGAGVVADSLEEGVVTHIILGSDTSRLKVIRKTISSWRRLPRIVTSEWVAENWKEKTIIDEERFYP